MDFSDTFSDTLQDFSSPADFSASAGRIALLRQKMREAGLDGFIVPRANAHQGEYVAPSDERLAWISGFTGSAGAAIILTGKAALFTDGRYQIQMAQQTDKNIFEHHHITRAPPAEWISVHLPEKAILGFDPWLHTISDIEMLQKAHAQLMPCAQNIIDDIWDERPDPPSAEVFLHKACYAGQNAAEKCRAISTALKKNKNDAFVLTDPASIAWLLNIRGGDVPHMPVALCFAIIHAGESHENIDLFIQTGRVSKPVKDGLGDHVQIKPPEAFAAALDALGQKKCNVRLDKNAAAFWIFDRLKKSGAKINFGADPCLLPKAIKNSAEINGARRAHLRDGAALTSFLCWLDSALQTQKIDEMKAVKKLESFRRTQKLFCDISFDTIAGAGANGAIVHYRVTPQTNRELKEGDLFLVDSGAQYLDGTTDVTRTIAIGQAGAEERENFTRVLKGHIALAEAAFPEGTTGHQLDALARRPLWQAGLDFDHGTGHGVGSFLSVHEGPQAISPRGSSTALRAGMIISNEPGYYKTGAYGIRIENLVAVQKRSAISKNGRAMLGFETLTCAPIDLNLVNAAQLDPDERNWLNNYHAHVRAALTPLVDEKTAAWLAQATRAI